MNEKLKSDIIIRLGGECLSTDLFQAKT